MREQLIEGAIALGLTLDKDKIGQVETLTALLQEANQSFNLTAVLSKPEIALQHFLDSWTCAPYLQPTGRLVDIGAGAGFPGLALKIIFPDLEVVLVEAVQKKAQFIDNCIKTLNLQGVQVLVTRAETLGSASQWRESFDFATCRAVGHLAVIAEYALPLLKINGFFLAQKGKAGLKEMAEAREGIALLGGQIEGVKPVMIPDLKERYLFLFKKITETPARFPRRVGVPRKRPLLIEE